MRIILVQAEIELAIREYVLGQLSIKEGQQINISFKNTRGDDGATAEIDINSPGQTVAAPAPARTGSVFARREPTGVVETVAAIVAEEAAESLQAAHAAEAAETDENPSQTSAAPAAEDGSTSATVEESNVGPASTGSDQTTSSEPVAGDSEVQEEIVRTVPFDADQPVDAEVVSEPIKPATGAKSLFANLKRPVNKPTPE